MKLGIVDNFRNRKKIKLYWFRPGHGRFKNFGDELSKEIVSFASGKEVVWADRTECDLVSVGSVLRDFIAQKRSVTVWGSGLMFDVDPLPYNKDFIDIRLVRGNLTDKILGLGQHTHGDPGLLVDSLFRPAKEKCKISVVPHYIDVDSSIIKKLTSSKDIRVVDVRESPEKVVSNIAASDLVLSSSLHGIIVAHSFGVPAYWVELSDGVAGSGFKFRDYFSVFDRVPDKIEASELVDIEKRADELISNFKPLANLPSIKEGVLSTFPSEFMHKNK